MPRLAFYTFGILKESIGHPMVQGFLDAAPDVFGEAENAPGYITRAIRPDLTKPYFGQNFGPFGDFAAPRFHLAAKDWQSRVAATLSLWSDIAPVHRFAYGGLHKEALARRTQWIVKPEYPAFAMWWVGDNETPTWQDASDRLEYLHDHGPSPRAFKFSSAFDAQGNRIAERVVS